MHHNDRFIVYDVNFEYDYREYTALVISNFKDLRKYLQEGAPRIIFRPMRTTKESIDFFFSCIWTLGRNYMVVISEFDEVVKKAGDAFNTLVHRGRHKGIGMFGDSRRPFGVPRLYLTQVDAFFLGWIKDIPEDMRYLREMLTEKQSTLLPQVKRYYFLRVIDEPEAFGCSECEKIVENKVAFVP